MATRVLSLGLPKGLHSPLNPLGFSTHCPIFNAFNENARRAVVENFENEPTLKHLAWLAAAVLAPYSRLETGGRRWGETGEGGSQGGPESAPFFYVAIHPASRITDVELLAGWQDLGWMMGTQLDQKMW